MRHMITKSISGSILLVMSSLAIAAGNCGAGRIIAIKEGYENLDHYMIKIDYRDSTETLPTLEGWIRFEKTLDVNRFYGIKALSYLAVSGGNMVSVHTHNADCTSATELTVFAIGINPT